MIKVLHVYRTYFPDTQGGGQEAIRQICLNTARHGIESRIFTPSADPRPAVIASDEGEIHRVKLNFEIASCGFCLTGLRKFRALVDWSDLVNYHFPWPFADFMHFLTRVDKKTVITYHSDIVRQGKLLQLYDPLLMRFLASANRIVCTSQNYLESSDYLRKFPKKTQVIPLALDEASYPVPTESVLAATRRQYGEKFFVFVGVLRYYKGLHILLDAAAGADFEVVIVGSGPIEHELKEQLRSCDITNVRFAGHVSNEVKVALIKLSLGVVLPSYLRSEAFGVTLLEGAMYAKPLVSTQGSTGTSYVNVDGETGVVVAPNDSLALRKGMDFLFQHEDIAINRGHKARARFDQLFSGAKMGGAYADLYNSLVEQIDIEAGC